MLLLPKGLTGPQKTFTASASASHISGASASRPQRPRRAGQPNRSYVARMVEQCKKWHLVAYQSHKKRDEAHGWPEYLLAFITHHRYHITSQAEFNNLSHNSFHLNFSPLISGQMALTVAKLVCTRREEGKGVALLVGKVPGSDIYRSGSTLAGTEDVTLVKRGEQCSRGNHPDRRVHFLPPPWPTSVKINWISTFATTAALIFFKPPWPVQHLYRLSIPHSQTFFFFLMVDVDETGHSKVKNKEAPPPSWIYIRNIKTSRVPFWLTFFHVNFRPKSSIEAPIRVRLRDTTRSIRDWDAAVAYCFSVFALTIYKSKGSRALLWTVFGFFLCVRFFWFWHCQSHPR